MRVRRLQEQLAVGEVARRRQALAEVERTEREAWDALDRRADAAVESAASLRTHRTMVAGGIAHATELGASARTSSDHLDQATQAWRLALQRLDGIERLTQRILRDEQAAGERAAIVELDDLVVMRWEGPAL
jgi:flagellar biosynthesis chaperone FliJ